MIHSQIFQGMKKKSFSLQNPKAFATSPGKLLCYWVANF